MSEYSISLVALTDATRPGYFDVSFSPGAGYYLLSYKGPGIPNQRLIEAIEGGEYASDCHVALQAEY